MRESSVQPVYEPVSLDLGSSSSDPSAVRTRSLLLRVRLRCWLVRAAPVAVLTVGRQSGTLGVMTSTPERMAIDHVAQRLSAQFCTLDIGLVARVVWDIHRHFDTHPTREFVPILVEDAARDRLRVMRPGTGLRSRERPAASQ